MTRYIVSFLLFLSIVLAEHCYAIRPPGTVKVKLNRQVLYVDKGDIKNIDWVEYIVWQKQKDTLFVMSHVDSATRTKAHNRHLPLVGITREQAETYSQWRTERVNELPKFIKSRKTVCYTLLTEEQCQLLSQKRKWSKQKLEANPFPTKGFRCVATMKKM